MALPTIISLSEDALKSVPKSFSQASLALGATKWQTVIRVKIPAAMSGIFAASMLGMGRAIGETMTVLMATGCAPAMPGSFFDSVRTITSTIAIELGEVPYYTTHYYALFAIGLILFIITFFVNMISDIILNKYEIKVR
jgi:phosphate transport system permease protein